MSTADRRLGGHRSNSRAGSLGLGEQEEEEPDWDLPPDLQEYSGNPSDRRAQPALPASSDGKPNHN